MRLVKMLCFLLCFLKKKMFALGAKILAWCSSLLRLNVITRNIASCGHIGFNGQRPCSVFFNCYSNEEQASAAAGGCPEKRTQRLFSPTLRLPSWKSINFSERPFFFLFPGLGGNIHCIFLSPKGHDVNWHRPRSDVSMSNKKEVDGKAQMAVSITRRQLSRYCCYRDKTHLQRFSPSACKHFVSALQQHSQRFSARKIMLCGHVP